MSGGVTIPSPVAGLVVPTLPTTAGVKFLARGDLGVRTMLPTTLAKRAAPEMIYLLPPLICICLNVI